MDHTIELLELDSDFFVGIVSPSKGIGFHEMARTSEGETLAAILYMNPELLDNGAKIIVSKRKATTKERKAREARRRKERGAVRGPRIG